MGPPAPPRAAQGWTSRCGADCGVTVIAPLFSRMAGWTSSTDGGGRRSHGLDDAESRPAPAPSTIGRIKHVGERPRTPVSRGAECHPRHYHPFKIIGRGRGKKVNFADVRALQVVAPNSFHGGLPAQRMSSHILMVRTPALAIIPVIGTGLSLAFGWRAIFVAITAIPGRRGRNAGRGERRGGSREGLARRHPASGARGALLRLQRPLPGLGRPSAPDPPRKNDRQARTTIRWPCCRQRHVGVIVHAPSRKRRDRRSGLPYRHGRRAGEMPFSREKQT